MTEMTMCTATHLRTRALPTTGLAELQAEASLLTRVDRKYLVPLEAAQQLVDSLAEHARVLQINGVRTFAYASTYFDTPGLDSYLLAAHKRRRRFKVRTRSYLDSGLCFLEVKTRGARGATVKQRSPWNIDSADRLTDQGRAFVARALRSSGTCPPSAAGEVVHALTPTLATTYQRHTLHLPATRARVTLDTRLSWWRLDPHTALPLAEAGLGDLAVVETKSPSSGPGPADRLLWECGHRPSTISKYATGLALLEPHLPANKWHRLLTGALAA